MRRADQKGGFMGKENKWLTYDSTVGELYDSPVGHDALAKVLLQIGLPEKVITNKAVSGLKLRTIANLTKKQLGMDFFDALLNLVDSEHDKPRASKGYTILFFILFYQIIKLP